MKPPPPPPDVREAKSGSRKVDHLQLFGVGGELIAESYWQPTGRYRLKIGWFGFAYVEAEESAFDSSANFPTVTRWRRAKRGESHPLRLNIPKGE